MPVLRREGRRPTAPPTAAGVPSPAVPRRGIPRAAQGDEAQAALSSSTTRSSCSSPLVFVMALVYGLDYLYSLGAERLFK